MNSVKFKNVLYDVREATDIRDMLLYGAEAYGEQAAYLVKNKPGGVYEPISYSRVKSDMNAIGTALLSEGFGGQKIAVIGENRYEWAVTYFAVVCGVGVIVPIDRELKAADIASTIDKSDVTAIVYSGKVEKIVLEAIGISRSKPLAISMDAAEDDSERRSLKKLIEKGLTLQGDGDKSYTSAEIDPDAMTALLWTSGTMGAAKGVMLTHRNITANVVNMSKYVNVRGWTALSVLPMHHTYEFTCLIFTAYYQGCTVAICEGLKYITKNLAECQANVVVAVPLLLEKMHGRIWKTIEQSGRGKTVKAAVAVTKKVKKQDKMKKKIFKAVHEALGGHMELLISGGAAIDPLVIEDFNAMGITMMQGYGMTENSPILCVNKDRYFKAASAGLPMPGTEVSIMEPDEEGVGEIACKGPSVMLGYYKNDEETANVLRDGWLYTGDYGYFDDDGFLFITGRKKNVIVTKNGKNIYPEEVEYFLGTSPFIEEVVVWGKDDPASGDLAICADIFPAYDEIAEVEPTADVRALIDREVDKANAKMPPFKRVKRFDIREEEFAKTTTQKIKRHEVKHEE
ncbi:MAG: AMP-binding protein [Clostridiales Family XIII bacterium]|jgi:long-chain acyl-CoA synthetase|nr:AMP-binding protein [Clostridiales Family XIII bacterium]